jgi:hypothetical protein
LKTKEKDMDQQKKEVWLDIVNTAFFYPLQALSHVPEQFISWIMLAIVVWLLFGSITGNLIPLLVLIIRLYSLGIVIVGLIMYLQYKVKGLL